jgi:hypothetical protein
VMAYPFIPDFLYAPVVYEEMCDYTVRSCLLTMLEI